MAPKWTCWCRPLPRMGGYVAKLPAVLAPQFSSPYAVSLSRYYSVSKTAHARSVTLQPSMKEHNTNGHTNGSSEKKPLRASTNGIVKNRPKWRFDTIQIHAGLEEDPKYGHCTLPIYNTASFKFGSSAALNVALSDISSSQNHLYTRVSNVSLSRNDDWGFV